MDEFLQDIAPFFYGKYIVYVDVGAYIGETYQAIRESGIGLVETCLIEPNPESFAALGKRVAKLGNDKRVTLRNVALGASEGAARMKAGGGMTKIMAVLPQQENTQAAAGMFDVPVTTLDALSDGFGRKHISLLKIDVEGFEEQVLNGAQELLKTEAIDVIYIEAGFDPENKQQCYYRRIEDMLAPHGYRIFRIYEQKNDWIDDDPSLRRVNIAFMSRHFTRENPFRITRELFDARHQITQHAHAIQESEQQRMRLQTENEDLQNRLDAATAQIADLCQQTETNHRLSVETLVGRDIKLAEKTQALNDAQTDNAVLRGDLEARVKDIIILTQKIEKAQRQIAKTQGLPQGLTKVQTENAALRDDLEARAKDALSLIRKIDKLQRHNDSLLQSTSWKITAPMRRAVNFVRGTPQ